MAKYNVHREKAIVSIPSWSSPERDLNLRALSAYDSI